MTTAPHCPVKADQRPGCPLHSWVRGHGGHFTPSLGVPAKERPRLDGCPRNAQGPPLTWGGRRVTRQGTARAPALQPRLLRPAQRQHFRWYGCRLPPVPSGLSPGSPAEFGVESLSLQVARQFAEAPGSTGDLSGTCRIAHGLPGPEPSLEAAETPLAFVWWSP